MTKLALEQCLERWLDLQPSAEERLAKREQNVLDSLLERRQHEMPAFLKQPDRQWERLLWLATFHSPGWSLVSLQEQMDLREFAVKSKQREAELSKNGIVLAVICDNTDGLVRNWEWKVLTPAAGPVGTTAGDPSL